MIIDYENAPRITCTECGKEYVLHPLIKSDHPYVCYSCKKKAEHEREKELITSPDCDADYEPYSIDDGYYCPYCGVFIDIDDDYEMYVDGSHDVTCPYCDKPFEVETYLSHSFTFTSKKGGCA